MIHYRQGNDLDLDAVIELYRASTLGERRPVDGGRPRRGVDEQALELRRQRRILRPHPRQEGLALWRREVERLVVELG